MWGLLLYSVAGLIPNGVTVPAAQPHPDLAVVTVEVESDAVPVKVRASNLGGPLTQAEKAAVSEFLETTRRRLKPNAGSAK